VVKLQILFGVALDAAAVVALPDEGADLGWDAFAPSAIDLFVAGVDCAETLDAGIEAAGAVPKQERDGFGIEAVVFPKPAIGGVPECARSSVKVVWPRPIGISTRTRRPSQLL
jgi:hypothetical protein